MQMSEVGRRVYLLLSTNEYALTHSGLLSHTQSELQEQESFKIANAVFINIRIMLVYCWFNLGLILV